MVFDVYVFTSCVYVFLSLFFMLLNYFLANDTLIYWNSFTPNAPLYVSSFRHIFPLNLHWNSFVPDAPLKWIVFSPSVVHLQITQLDSKTISILP